MTRRTPPTLADMIEAGRAYEQRLRGAQASLEAALVTGRSTDGVVVVLATGLGRLRAVQVSPTVFDNRDVTALQDAIAQAVRAAAANAAALSAEKMGPIEINLH
ncbi:YbaB/EbfC family nucleoid-associated protein [Micromonospora sp. WMMD882]|uniref:YbaB/EbfC family nucleoid-associated protein n=1 Tax=Micromonospora sp. WMMD882 TaxID=3015151 RepID=UPI00248B47AF|nr:YbaB/EbfC family nucleoid-associated protein [Micromonospora sp. WMMD882]WBB80463.1 YbaB/EbfC family nucleoid-associated protein [Micromonospora sp. WMMD882]